MVVRVFCVTPPPKMSLLPFSPPFTARTRKLVPFQNPSHFSFSYNQLIHHHALSQLLPQSLQVNRVAMPPTIMPLFAERLGLHAFYMYPDSAPVFAHTFEDAYYLCALGQLCLPPVIPPPNPRLQFIASFQPHANPWARGVQVREQIQQSVPDYVPPDFAEQGIPITQTKLPHDQISFESPLPLSIRKREGSPLADSECKRRRGFGRQSNKPTNAPQQPKSSGATSPSFPPQQQQPSFSQSSLASSHSNMPQSPSLTQSPSLENTPGHENNNPNRKPPFFFREQYANLIVKGNFMTLAAKPVLIEEGEWLAHQGWSLPFSSAFDMSSLPSPAAVCIRVLVWLHADFVVRDL